MSHKFLKLPATYQSYSLIKVGFSRLFLMKNKKDLPTNLIVGKSPFVILHQSSSRLFSSTDIIFVSLESSIPSP